MTHLQSECHAWRTPFDAYAFGFRLMHTRFGQAGYVQRRGGFSGERAVAWPTVDGVLYRFEYYPIFYQTGKWEVFRYWDGRVEIRQGGELHPSIFHRRVMRRRLGLGGFLCYQADRCQVPDELFFEPSTEWEAGGVTYRYWTSQDVVFPTAYEVRVDTDGTVTYSTSEYRSDYGQAEDRGEQTDDSSLE